MQPTLKVLKHVNRHLHSSQKFINETGKTLCDHFDAVYGSLTLSYLLSTLGSTDSKGKSSIRLCCLIVQKRQKILFL